MKRMYSVWSAMLLMLWILMPVSAAAAQLYGVNPFANDATNPPSSYGLFDLDYNTGAITDGRVITLVGYTITGALAIARDPTTGLVYAILKAQGVNGRLLATIEVTSGAATLVGNLGDNFSSLAFRSDGQLFGVTGDGAAVSETLYMIDKSNAGKTLITHLGNGADGEVIAYNPNDNSFYHWSGNGTVVFERVLAEAPYTVTSIFTGTGIGGEVFGAVWDPARGVFLVHNISSYMSSWTTAGVRSDIQAATSADVRGLLLVPDAVAVGKAVPSLSEWGIAMLSAIMAILVAASRRRVIRQR